MDLTGKIQKFDSDLNDTITAAVNDGVPLDYMASRLAGAEFELRTTILQMQRQRAAQALAHKIIPANGALKLPHLS